MPWKGYICRELQRVETMDIDIEKLIGECVFTAVRSSGSGGQNVNKVASKVLLSFDVNASAVLDWEQKRLVLAKLSNRINKNGVLQVSSDAERTQWQNKKAVTAKFRQLIGH